MPVDLRGKLVGPLGYDPKSHGLRARYDKSIFTMDPKSLPEGLSLLQQGFRRTAILPARIAAFGRGGSERARTSNARRRLVYSQVRIPAPRHSRIVDLRPKPDPAQHIPRGRSSATDVAGSCFSAGTDSHSPARAARPIADRKPYTLAGQEVASLRSGGQELHLRSRGL